MIGTTPELTFDLPINTSDIQKLYITFKDKDKNIVFEKTEADCVLSNKTVKVELSQEETLLFGKRTKVRMQMRVLTKDNKALKSQIFTMDIGDLLKEGVI